MTWFKTKLFWNKHAHVTYFRDKPADPRIERRLKQFISVALDKNNIKALDLGCGGGRHTMLLLELGFKTSIVDLHRAMLRATVSRARKYKLSGIKRATMTNVPFRDESFEVVVATGVLHQARNLAEYDSAVREVSRVLKPGGLLCLNVFSSKTLDPSYFKLKDAFAYQTKEGLAMTLLSKDTFMELMSWHGLALDEDLGEDTVEENTGRRSVLRCSFTKLT